MNLNEAASKILTASKNKTKQNKKLMKKWNAERKYDTSIAIVCKCIACMNSSEVCKCKIFPSYFFLLLSSGMYIFMCVKISSLNKNIHNYRVHIGFCHPAEAIESNKICTHRRIWARMCTVCIVCIVHSLCMCVKSKCIVS